MDDKSEYYEEQSASIGEFRAAPIGSVKNLPEKDPSLTVEKGVVFDVPFLSLNNRDVTEMKECYIVLFDRFMVYKCVANYISKDNELELEREYRSNYRTSRARAHITNVEMYFHNVEDKWLVSVDFLGKDPLGWYFESPKAAKKLYEILQNYWVTCL